MIRFEPFVDGYYDVADQMVRDLRRRADLCFRRREEEKSAITTQGEFEAYREKMRRQFLNAIGGLPAPNGELNPRITGTIPRNGFRIEKLLYESQPQFYVTALVYVPDGLTEPAPAILFVHGHAENGKAYPEYQAVCTDLARNGFVVLAVDPPGQGERFQYLDPTTGERVVGPSTTEHTYAGLQYVMGGASIVRHFIGDAMRGIDYLQSRPEVDGDRIGVTGNSGGGLQTSLLMLAEPRLAAAMPCTFVMTLESYLATGQPQDAEQIVRGGIVWGPDHDDYLTAMAPKPVQVGAVASDFFPLEGTKESVERAKRIYRLYDREDNIDLVVGNSRHEYSPRLREAAVNWFSDRLRGQQPNFIAGEVDPLPEEALWVTPKGQVGASIPGSRTLFELNRERLQAQSRLRRFPLRVVAPHSESSGEIPLLIGLWRQIRETLGVSEDRSGPIHPRVIWNGEWEGRRAEKLFFFSEPGIVVTGIFLAGRNDGEPASADLVLLPEGTASAPEYETSIRKRLETGRSLLLFDVRGTGGVVSRPINPYALHFVHGTEYRLAMDAMMLGISTLGLRVYDALRGFDYLRTRSDISEIGLIGAGSGAMIGLFAGALEPDFRELTFADAFTSYHSLAETRYYDRDRFTYPLTPWGIGQALDIVDLLPAFAPRPTAFLRPRTPDWRIQTEDELQSGFMGQAEELGPLSGGWKPTYDLDDEAWSGEEGDRADA